MLPHPRSHQLPPTDEQIKAIQQRGNFVVSACPGSGKTYVVAARFADIARSWQNRHIGIAVISFTNVAWQEIDERLRNEFEFHQGVNYPHYLGTIDSFINRHVFFPFGHRIMGCSNRPILIGPPANEYDPINMNGWYWKYPELAPYKYRDFHYNIDGKSVNSIRFNICQNPTLVAKVLSIKKSVNRAGYATQSDANYISLTLLREYPEIVISLANRYPILMVDEAQDTNEIQMAIIDLLLARGAMNDVMLVGDPDQSIFAFNRAKPELFLLKADNWKERSIDFTGNRRSSQKVCNFTSRLRLSREISNALDEDVKLYDYEPAIWGYTEATIAIRTKEFLDICIARGITLSPDSIAVLSRSRGILQKCFGIPNEDNETQPWNDAYTRHFAKARFLYDQGKFLEALNACERGFLKFFKSDVELSELEKSTIVKETSFAQWRQFLFELINELSNTNCSLGEWIKRSNDNFQSLTNLKNIEFSIKSGGKYAKYYREMTFEHMFSEREVQTTLRDYLIATVHSVKGETYEAVMLVLGKKGIGPNYINLLKSKQLAHEELRIVYVGMTRPRKILVLCVPEEDKNDWEMFFRG